MISLRAAVVALVALAPALHAATINWTTTTVSAPADVSMYGTLVGAMNVGDSADAQIINGVTFAPDSGGTSTLSFGSATVTFSFDGSSYDDYWAGSDPAGSASYGAALDYGRYSDGGTRTGTVTLGGLAPGHVYQVQIWIVDTRTPNLDTRVRTVDGVSTTGAGPNIATGIFTADTSTQVMTTIGTTGGDSTLHGPQVNLLQLRDVSGIILSNLGNDTASYLDSASGYLAQAFDAGPVATTLNGITVRLANYAGTTQARVQLWSGSGAAPVTLVEDLGVSTSFTDSSDVDYVFTSTAHPVLAANTRYWLVVSNVSGAGAFYWRNSSNAASVSSVGATLPAARATSSDGSTWTEFTGSNYQLFSISSAIVVSTTADSGSGSLRQAIADAAARPGADTIVFDPALNGQRIHLTTSASNSAITINDSGGLAIDASALPNGMTIDDGSASTYRLFSVQGGFLILRRLTLANGGGSGFYSSGGAINNLGNLTLDCCTLSGNSGAIANAGTMTLTQCTLSANSSQGSGGAITNDGTMTLTQCTFSGNSSRGSGGAISNNHSMTLTQCTLSGNSSEGYGGAIANGGTAVVMQSTLAGNIANGGYGGAIANGGLGGGAFLSQCTLTGNVGFFGGAILAAGFVVLTHCTLSGNQTTGFSIDIPVGGSVELMLSNTILDNERIFDQSFQSRITFNGANLVNQPALLAPLGSYGGSTQTMALLPGSPARNAAVSSTIISDQRGFPIIGTPDIGAYEAGTLDTSYNAYIWESLPSTATVAQHASTFDFDGDGVTNVDEWPALTDPGSASSVLRFSNITPVGDFLHVSFPSVAGRNYTFEYSTDLINWQTVPPGTPIPGSGDVINVPIGPVNGYTRYFLRLRVGP